jgi:serine/threonine-protein kinase RsbW
MATVEVAFTPLPAHVRTARLVATAVARRSGVDESLLDEVRLAVGEACSRAVEAHRKHCPTQPVRVALSDNSERFEVVVTDAAPPDLTAAADVAHSPASGSTASAGGNGHAPGAVAPAAGPDGSISQLPADVGLAVISGLADDVRIVPAEEGTSIAMSWKRRADPA